MKNSLEFKAGIFVITGLGLLGIVLFNLQIFTGSEGYRINVNFKNANGLEVGAPVQLAGVGVGSVDGITIRRDPTGSTYVSVNALISEGIQIEPDAEANITTGGLLGQKYLQIYPGTLVGKPLTDGSHLRGMDPLTIEHVARTGQRIVGKLESSVDSINKMIGDEEFRVQLKSNTRDLGLMLQDIRETTTSLKLVLARLESGEGTIGRLLTDEEIYDDVRDLVSDIKQHPWKLLKKGK